MLAGWNLTLPVPGAKGDAQVVAPAAAAPPWLTADDAGNLVFWAPVNGVTTKNSEHARTELDRTENFTAGAGPQTLTASLTVTQVPDAVPEVIVGQIHGAGDISSVPFVMVFYGGGTVRAVVKQEQSGEAHTDVPLLTGVPLGTPFDYTIRDNGDGSIAVTAAAGGRTASGSAPVPAAFSGTTVRFQAGAYQQAPSAGGTAAPDDGARVTFSALNVGTEPPPS
jgi:Alginate lyase